MVLISYDVSTTDTNGPKRLRQIAKACENWGQRVQFSLFECIVDPSQWTALKNKLISIINQEKDSLRFYYLGSNWQKRVEHVGTKAGIEQEGFLHF